MKSQKVLVNYAGLENPDFNPERDFYYARVIEKPVCRWSWHQCVEFVNNSHPK